MKKTSKELQEIERNAWATMRKAENAMKNEAEAWQAEYETHGDTIRERINWGRGEGAERKNAHEVEYMRLAEDFRRKKDFHAVAKFNAEKRHAEDVACALVAIFKKYDGKQYGKATARKMSEELGKMSGASLWFEAFYDTRCDTVKCSQWLTFTAYKNGERCDCRNENNTIQAVDEFRVWGYAHDYIDDTETYIAHMDELRAEAERSAAVAKSAARAYSAEAIKGLPEFRA